MKTIIKIAWRNLWRNKLRTFVIITSIILGLWGSMFFMSMINGMNSNRMDGAVNTYLAHIQIHSKAYLEDPVVENFLSDKQKTIDQLNKLEEVESYTTRLIVDAMASSSKGSYGTRLCGINPEEEKTVYTIAEKLVEGTFLTRLKKPSVVIGKKLAEKLGVKLNRKIKFSFQNQQGDILNYSFRVEGIYKIDNSMIERSQVYIKQQDLDKIINAQGKIHEIAIVTKDINQTDQLRPILQKINDKNIVRTWDEIAPELGYAQETMAIFTYIFMVIILIALAFGIVNTMLMAVLERKRELGIMMAVGFNKSKLFLMIITETIFLALISTPIGMFVAYQTIEYFGRNGLNFTSVAEGLEYFGVGATFYTELDPSYYFWISLMTIFTALIAAIFPSRKAIQTKPIEAIRDV